MVCVSAATAQDIRIACVIPAVPGQNVALVNEQSYKESKPSFKDALVLQKQEQQARIAQGASQVFTIQTVYSR